MSGDVRWSRPAESSAIIADQEAELIARICWVYSPWARVVPLPLALIPGQSRGDTATSDPGGARYSATEQ
jgi:hypothetical protein